MYDIWVRDVCCWQRLTKDCWKCTSVSMSWTWARRRYGQLRYFMVLVLHRRWWSTSARTSPAAGECVLPSHERSTYDLRWCCWMSRPTISTSTHASGSNSTWKGITATWQSRRKPEWQSPHPGQYSGEDPRRTFVLTSARLCSSHSSSSTPFNSTSIELLTWSGEVLVYSIQLWRHHFESESPVWGWGTPLPLCPFTYSSFPLFTFPFLSLALPIFFFSPSLPFLPE